MTKIMLFVLSCFMCLTMSAVNKEDLNGVWTSSTEYDDGTTVTVDITITNDSITFDEIGNEGFTYSYTVNDDDITYFDGFVNSIIHIVYLDKETLAYRFDGENVVYLFGRKPTVIY